MRCPEITHFLIRHFYFCKQPPLCAPTDKAGSGWFLHMLLLHLIFSANDLQRGHQAHPIDKTQDNADPRAGEDEINLSLVVRWVASCLSSNSKMDFPLLYG
jgi:hypothetical protein